MQVVEIVICNNKYKISCESEKKDHLLRLAGNFDKLVSSISQKTGSKGSEALNFLLAALTLEDKILELTGQLGEINQEREKYRNEKKTKYTKVLNRVNKIITNLEYTKD
ncbi:cell division protein ZapA [Wolbachia endosymbiont of Folsomia candida]|uniref:cell division protein ZapA n=1 Tax=Wolbachia endosymbiont of Folsomia candida TaxID=169402 RepID=UPI000B239508|nr:cell division protein ZapA [Wolbachia endosymbiont of Folsomia candida]APR98037.1 cell division protein ZapA [Wolbachia endosymbiont of Folsomia candida]